MLAAAVGSAPGVARTRPMAPRDRRSKRMGVITGLEARFGHLRSLQRHPRCSADSQPWTCAAGKPCREFGLFSRHAGMCVLSYDRTHLQKVFG